MADARTFDDTASASRYLRVSRGLFVLRYVSSKGGLAAPEVMISHAPGPRVDVISADNVPNPILRAPGDAVVIRAEQDASIVATVMPTRPGGSRDAQLVFERVSQAALPADTRDPWFAPVAQPQSVTAPTVLTSPGIIAHVARRGDVSVAPGDWVCGPQLPMIIEGMQLNWANRPHDVDILMGCSINARARRTVAPSPTGVFVGTRGKAAPIIGLTLILTGPGADRYRLRAEALFLGAPVQIQDGQSLEFVGPSGLEPLVGLRLTIEGIGRDARTAPWLVAPQTPDFGGSDAPLEFGPKANPISGRANLPDIVPSVSAARSGRVRVFRAQRPNTQT